MNNYEALYILDTRGKDDSVQEILDRIETEIRATGGAIQGVQRMDKRKFERGQHGIDTGFFVNIRFAAPTEAIAKLREKFNLNREIFRQMYLRVGKVSQPAAA
jgi:small subunit ribosomal protein S6